MPPVEVDPAYQERVCLGGTWDGCPLFLAAQRQGVLRRRKRAGLKWALAGGGLLAGLVLAAWVSVALGLWGAGADQDAGGSLSERLALAEVPSLAPASSTPSPTLGDATPVATSRPAGTPPATRVAGGSVLRTPTPTNSATPRPTWTRRPSPTTTASVASTPSDTPLPPTATGTPEPTETPLQPTMTPTREPTPEPTDTPRPSTATASPSPTVTSSPTATPPPTAEPTVTPSPTATSTPTSTPTATASPAPRMYQAPELVAPADGATFGAGDAVVLRWAAVGPLATDEWYEVIVAYNHQGQTWYDETPWLRTESWELSSHRYLLDLSSDGVFRWSVRVVRQLGTDEDGVPISEPASPSSAARSLRWTASSSPPATAAPPPP